MEIRPLSNKTWASIFIATVFLAIVYFLHLNPVQAQPEPPPMVQAATDQGQ
jgi:hypothetical protein